MDTVYYFYIFTENGSDFKNLHLHLKVEKPGKFCCNDGVCIDSKYVCDQVPHCGDGEDEAGDLCVQISMDHNKYKVDQAPIGFEIVDNILSKSKTVVNISVDVYDLVNIDVSNAFFKVIFRNLTI